MNRIKELRKRKGITMDELATKVGVKSQRTVVNWENGSSQIKPDKSQKLAEYFGVSESYLLGYSDDNQKPYWNSVVEYLMELSESDYKKMIEVVDRKREENWT